MKAFCISTNNIDLLSKQLIEIDQSTVYKSALILMADKNHYSNETLTPLLKKFNKPIIGGVFPEVIYMGERKKEGVLLLALETELKTQLFDLSDNSDEYFRLLESFMDDSPEPKSGLLVFIDALSSNKQCFIESLFNFFGIFPTYMGGGAGSLSFESFPNIIDNDGMHSNAVVIGWLNEKIALGVAHGWHSFSEPLKVTEACGNQIKSINWEPAFEIYKQIVEQHSGLEINSDNFFQIARSYPLGIVKIDAEMVVRDPFKVNNNAIHLVDLISEGEYVHILHGDLKSLLAGASKAKEMAFSKLGEGRDPKSVFCIDCISRVLYLQDDFEKELQIIAKDIEANGILTIGEIANPGESFLEIYNKTVVIGIW